MQAAEYFDSIAQFWDMEYSDNELAREITAAISAMAFEKSMPSISHAPQRIRSRIIPPLPQPMSST